MIRSVARVRQPGVTETVEIGCREWIAFLESQDDATPFHHPAWTKVVSEVYGFEAAAFIVRAPDGAIAAGLPAIQVPSLGRRGRWKCLPFTDTCGPLGDERSVNWLMASLRSKGDQGWEVRSPVPALGAVQPVAVTHTLDLRPGLESVYAGFHSSQVKRALRKAGRQCLVQVREASERRDLTDIYYALHVSTRKRQGAPPQPRRLFGAIWDELHLTGLASTYLAEIDGRPVAGAVFLHWNRVLVYKYGASDADAWKARPNHVIFWRAIESGCEAGMRRLDLGLTDAANQGLRTFKSNWGAHEEELCYTTWGAGSKPRSTSHSRAQALLGQAIRRSSPSVCEMIGTAIYRFAA